MGLIRVLVVEDRSDFQKIFRDVVESLGYDVELASNIEEARNKLARMLFHAALVDLSLDDNDHANRDGFMVLSDIKSSGDGTHSIVLSAYAEIEDADIAFARQYDLEGFIAKNSMKLSDLSTRIRNVVEKHRQHMLLPKYMLDFSRLGNSEAVNNFLKDNGESFENLSLLLKRLLSRFSPVLLRKDKEIIYRPQGNIDRTIQFCFWSRMIGGPIALRIGNAEEITGLFQRLGSIEARTAINYGEQIDEINNGSMTSHFRGVVYTVEHDHFENFDRQTLYYSY